MRKIFLLVTVLFSLSLSAAADNDEGRGNDFFNLFPTLTTEAIPYRIPAIACTAGGRLVAVADYRFCRADIGFGHIDLHCRVSDDNGATWGDIFTIVEGDGKKVDNNPNLSLTAGYGDPCIVADRESNRVLLICVCGYQTYFAATREFPNQVARLYSEDGGLTWSAPEVITEQFYTPLDKSMVGPIQSMFIGSGRIHQSSIIKTGDYYRLYACMLARDKDNNFCNFVVYSDDFGKNWKILGGVDVPPVPRGGDEPKTEELPDGSILLSSRCGGGRLYNIFTFTDAEKAEGYWGVHAFSGAQNNGVTAKGNSCNGEVMVLPVTRNSDGKGMFLALQSLPLGEGRHNVGIYYKELATFDDYNYPENFAKDWDGHLQVTDKASAYSTMIQKADGAIAFLYEEDTHKTQGGGYSIIYKSFTIEDITGGRFSYNPAVDRPQFVLDSIAE